MFAGVLVSTQTSMDRVTSERGLPGATANQSFSYQISEVESELRVIETRELNDDKGVVVFDRSGVRDSVVVDVIVLEQVHVGDLLSDYEGTIER